MLLNHRERIALAIANWILRMFAPSVAEFIGGAIEYGMRSAAHDEKQGNGPPPDWRPNVQS